MLFGTMLLYAIWSKVKFPGSVYLALVARALGKIIKDAREKAGLSQSALARASQIAPNVVSRIEAGKRPNLQFVTVARLAKSLGLSLGHLAEQVGISIGKRGAGGKPNTSVKSIDELARAGKELAKIAERVTHSASELRSKR